MFPQASDWLYELAFRESDGIEVALLWDGAGNSVLLNVRDVRAGEWFVCNVDGGRALDAFRHPFAYVDRRRDRAEHWAVRPGYHLNKRHWITVTLDSSLPDELVFGLLEDSFELVVDGLPKRERDRVRLAPTDEPPPPFASVPVRHDEGGRMQPRVLLGGLAIPESPRWHDGRLWFSNWGTRQIVAVDLDGNSDVVGEGPDGLGWATNWLPDGRMLVTGPELTRVEPDGSRVRHADLSHISPFGWSEVTADGRGNVYVNTINFDFAAFDEVLGSGTAPGKIALVTPHGEAREVATELAFPNGMVVRPDNRTLVVAESFAARLTAFDIEDDGTLSNRRVWADGVGPDGICLDSDGCIWASSANMANDCARIREGGEVLERIDLGRPCFATMLGGPERRSLFMLTADWRGTEGVEDVISARTGQVLVVEAPAPGVGWP